MGSKSGAIREVECHGVNKYWAERKHGAAATTTRSTRETWAELLDGNFVLFLKDVGEREAFGTENAHWPERAEKRLYEKALDWLSGLEEIDNRTKYTVSIEPAQAS